MSEKLQIPFQRPSSTGPLRLSAIRDQAQVLRTRQAEPMLPPVPIEGKLIATYDYQDEKGATLFRVHRYDPKKFSRSGPDGAGPLGGRLTVYRLPAVMAAGSVLVLEGEKDVDTAYGLGLPPGWAATTNPGGAGKWYSEYSEILRGKNVILCPDQDHAGAQHLTQVAIDLMGKAADLRVLTLPEPAKDLSAWVEAGGTREQLSQLLRGAQPIDDAGPPAAASAAVEALEPAPPSKMAGATRPESR
jgi:hypothetical protein